MINRYDFIDNKEALTIFNKAEWILKSDYKYRNLSNDGETALLESVYTAKQRFGYTDYKDHRQDSLKDIKSDILKSAKKRCGWQRLHFYKDISCKIPLQRIICWGYNGGISAEFID